VIIVLHVIISILIAWEVEHGLKIVKKEQEMDEEHDRPDSSAEYSCPSIWAAGQR